MPYNPHIHHRRSIRLKGYDYSQAGLYFITICCGHRVCRFGRVVKGEMLLNEFGSIAYEEWLNLASRFPNFALDVFQVMPNHVHVIIGIKDLVGAGLVPAHKEEGTILSGQPVRLPFRAGASPAPTIGDMIGAYKSLVANSCLKIYAAKNETMGALWQRNYYEHIIRDEKAYNNISDYIINNPVKWAADKFYNM